jgi:hypothetical protein
VGLLLGEPEAGGLIDVSRRNQDAVGPERNPPVANLPSEANALLYEAFSDAEPSGARFDEK